MLMMINMLIYIYRRENEDVLDEIIYQVMFWCEVWIHEILK